MTTFTTLHAPFPGPLLGCTHTYIYELVSPWEVELIFHSFLSFFCCTLYFSVCEPWTRRWHQLLSRWKFLSYRQAHPVTFSRQKLSQLFCTNFRIQIKLKFSKSCGKTGIGVSRPAVRWSKHASRPCSWGFCKRAVQISVLITQRKVIHEIMPEVR